MRTKTTEAPNGETVETLTPQRVKAYCQGGGIICPFCESDNIEGQSAAEVNEGLTTQEVRCLDCGQEWEDVSVLSGIYHEPTRSSTIYGDEGDAPALLAGLESVHARINAILSAEDIDRQAICEDLDELNNEVWAAMHAAKGA